MFTPSNKMTMSMWRLLTVLVTLAVHLVVAAARHSGLVAVAVQQVTTIKPRDLYPVPRSEGLLSRWTDLRQRLLPNLKPVVRATSSRRRRRIGSLTAEIQDELPPPLQPR
jgi:hypothetical protein